MALFICIVIGILFSLSIFLLQSRSLLKWMIGIAILTSTINLIILICGRLTTEGPSFIAMQSLTTQHNVSNPLSQALILTAIVIGFGLLVFALMLIRKIWKKLNTVDSNKLNASEQIYSVKIK